MMLKAVFFGLLFSVRKLVISMDVSSLLFSLSRKIRSSGILYFSMRCCLMFFSVLISSLLLVVSIIPFNSSPSSVISS